MAADPQDVWPPPPTRPALEVEIDNAEQQRIRDARRSVFLGNRFLILSAVSCVPFLFLPFAFYHGAQANKISGRGAGSRVLLLGALLAGASLAAFIAYIVIHK